MTKNCQNKLKQTWWCNKHTKLQFQYILKTENLNDLQTATNQPKSTVEFGYSCPRGLIGPPAVTLTN